MTPQTLPDRLLAEANLAVVPPRTGEILREAAAALSAPEGDMARALEWLRGFGWVVPDTVKSAIEEAIAAYDPERAGAYSGKLSGREAVGEVRIADGCIVSTSIKRPLPDGGYDVVPQGATTPQPGDGVVEANALSTDELVELDKLVADVGPQQALNMFVELRAEIAGKVDEADRSIAELKRRAAAPSAKGVA